MWEEVGEILEAGSGPQGSGEATAQLEANVTVSEHLQGNRRFYLGNFFSHS